MRENKSKTGLVIGILLLVITVLLIFVAYAFAIKPAITGFVTKTQSEGYNQGYAFAIVSIMEQASQCQQVPLTFGNQTMNMIWVECLNRVLEQQAQP